MKFDMDGQIVKLSYIASQHSRHPIQINDLVCVIQMTEIRQTNEYLLMVFEIED